MFEPETFLRDWLKEKTRDTESAYKLIRNKKGEAAFIKMRLKWIHKVVDIHFKDNDPSRSIDMASLIPRYCWDEIANEVEAVIDDLSIEEVADLLKPAA